ncbi:DNA replication complex GINS family protein [Candidatus Woesearchaeota archaeon]|nr:DNA replication complex GINS family protein [Candidatus Woesearchaeota archaeon]
MGGEMAITFETLYDILMREKQQEELLQLEPTFFQDVIHYLQEKMVVWEKISKETDLFSLGERDKVEAEIKNIRKLMKDIYERREKKIISIAVSKSRIGHALDVNNLLKEEKQFLESVAAVLDQYRHGVLLNVLQMKTPQIEEQKLVVEVEQKKKEKTKETMLVRFIHAVPKFVGSDLAIYGPFDENDVASLPKDVSEILINKKRAEEVKKENSTNY